MGLHPPSTSRRSWCSCPAALLELPSSVSRRQAGARGGVSHAHAAHGCREEVDLQRRLTYHPNIGALVQPPGTWRAQQRMSINHLAARQLLHTALAAHARRRLAQAWPGAACF